MVYETLLIATDAHDNQFEYTHYIEGPKEFSHFIASLHAQYSKLVERGICKVYSLVCWEMEEV